MDENEEFEFRLRAEQEAAAQSVPAPARAAPVRPPGTRWVADDAGNTVERPDFGLREAGQAILDLPGVGTAANASVGAYNVIAKAISGLAGLLGGDVEKTREKLSVQ